MHAAVIDERTATGLLSPAGYRVEFVDEGMREHETWQITQTTDVAVVINWARENAARRQYTVFLEIPTPLASEVTLMPLSTG